jgi:Peptidase family S41
MKTLRRASLRGVIAALAATSSLVCAQEPFDRGKWIADFEQLKTALTANYPNLEWAAERGVDLPALERRARDQIAAAAEIAGARTALERFIRAFGDGHMSLTWAAPGPPPGVDDTRPLCARLGYRAEPDTRAIARGVPGYRALTAPDAYIGAGLLDAGGRKLGVLRIPLFLADASMCAAALRELGLDADAECSVQCRDDIERRSEALLVAAFADGIAKLVAAKPDVLLVDVAGNGGGNDSAIVAARMLAAPPLPTPRMSFVRGPERAADLAEDLQRLREASARGDAKEKAFLSGIVTRVEDAQRQAAQPCDLSPLWLGKPAGCSNLVSGARFAGGVIDQELPADLRKRRWASLVSATARYDFTPALWTGPLEVLVDGGSGSATELFAAMLQDAGRARVIGAPSVGSGCGWTLPRRTIVLANSGGQLQMPDCARLRRDGSNELDGIQPDVLIGFRSFDSPRQRAARLAVALKRL